jgi:YD repeat-containing protein
MKHWVVVFFSTVLALSLSVSCASAAKSVAVEPKYADVTVWKVQEIVVSYPDGIVSSYNRLKYDADGNLLRDEELSGAKVPVSRKDSVYAADGSVTVTTVNASEEIMGKTRLEYVSGRLMKETLLNAKDEVQSTIEYVYDAQGKKTARNVKTASGNVVLTEYSWDKDRLAKIAIMDAGRNPVKRFDRVYDKAGTLVSEDEYGADGQLIGKTVYTYDGKNLIKEERQNPTGGILSSIKYVNDANGNPVEINFCDRLGEVIEVRKQSWASFTHTVRVN